MKRTGFRMVKGIVIGLILGFSLSVYADKISAPPPLADNPALQHYLQDIYVNMHRLEVVTTNPDGNRNGKRGDIVLLQTGGNNYLEVNTDSTNQWRGILLSDTP